MRKTASPIHRPASVLSPTRMAVVRAVASSTAIETGQRIASLERTLLDQTSKFRHLKLAD